MPVINKKELDEKTDRNVRRELNIQIKDEIKELINNTKLEEKADQFSRTALNKLKELLPTGIITMKEFEEKRGKWVGKAITNTFNELHPKRVETVKEFREKRDNWIISALDDTIKRWSENIYKYKFKSAKHKLRAKEKIIKQINRIVFDHIGKLINQKMIPLQEKRYTEEMIKQFRTDMLFIHGRDAYSLLSKVDEFQLPKQTKKRGAKKKSVEHQVIYNLVKIINESTNLTVENCCSLVSDLLFTLDKNKKDIIYHKIDFSNLIFHREDVLSIYYKYNRLSKQNVE
jgi:hypothetical protein